MKNKTLKKELDWISMIVPLAVVLSLGLALMLEARIPLKSEFRTFFLSPMMVPIASIILIWQVLFHYNGVVNEFLAVFGADNMVIPAMVLTLIVLLAGRRKLCA